MKIGAVYPQIELGGAPEALDAIGRAVETMGLDHLVLYDHVVGAVHAGREPPLSGPYTERDPFHDPFVAFGYLAGVTKRIEFVTGVLVLPQRQTVLVAKQATDVDLLSGGRLCLGVGIGWNYVEYDALGQNFKTRGDRLGEQIPFLRRLWSEEAFSWTGKYDSIDRGNIIPRPRRMIPIYVGGITEPAYRRAANLADGFIFAGHEINEVINDWHRLEGMIREAGRSPEEFGRHTFIMNTQYAGVDPAVAVDWIRRWQDAGGTYASIVTMGRGYTTAEQHIDHLNEVKHRLG